MEVILKTDIKNLGYKDDVVSVKNGYGRNFLIPQGKAIEATGSNKKVLAENLKQRAFKEEKLRKEAQAELEKLQKLSIKVGAKVSSTGKIFGSVNAIQIADAINANGLKVDRKKISVKADSIKELGKYKANVGLYKDINLDIEFEVIAE